jgi:hypothetical protein
MEATSSEMAADAWRERITTQQASGQSIRAWCREHSLPEPAFYWWRRRLGLGPKLRIKRSPRRAAVKSLKFAEVVVDRAGAAPSTSSGQAEPMCLRLGGGRELLLPASMPLQQVANLLRTIEGQPSANGGAS